MSEKPVKNYEDGTVLWCEHCGGEYHARTREAVQKLHAEHCEAARNPRFTYSVKFDAGDFSIGGSVPPRGKL